MAYCFNVAEKLRVCTGPFDPPWPSHSIFLLTRIRVFNLPAVDFSLESMSTPTAVPRYLFHCQVFLFVAAVAYPRHDQ